MASPMRSYRTGRFLPGASRTFALSMSGLVGDAMRQLGPAASKGLQELASRLEQPPDRSAQRTMYQRLGLAAQAAVLRAYESEVDSNGHIQYRRGSNRLTGRLKPLLQGNVDGTVYRVVNGQSRTGGVRIELFNPKAMNARAQHWARLNFGAGVAGAGSRSQHYTIRLRGAARDIGFNAGPRPGFRIPRGFWYQGGEAVPPGMPIAGSAFYLRRQGGFAPPQTPMITRGIIGRHFLEAGLDIFARQAPEAFNELIRATLGARSRIRFQDTIVGHRR